jgi:hypothetical protein
MLQLLVDMFNLKVGSFNFTYSSSRTTTVASCYLAPFVQLIVLHTLTLLNYATGNKVFVTMFHTYSQWWANLDQTPNDLDKTIFRDLSPTPLP